MVVTPLRLGQRPTPLHRLPRLSERLGAEIWIKRDDLTGFGLSGNKVRKLEFLLSNAVDDGVHSVITTGGLQSNHCRATAIVCRQLGLNPVLLLRGEAPPEWDGNLLLNQLVGAKIHYCTPETYRHHRDEVMQNLANELADGGHLARVIPEGGSNGLGAMAFVSAANEVNTQRSVEFDTTIVAVGSGGTLAGLVLGTGLGCVLGVAVCDDRGYFIERVEQISDDATSWGSPVLMPPGDEWDVLEGYQGPAYGVATPEVWKTIHWLAENEGMLLDPVYTGKAMHALISEVEAGRLGGRLLFWHTGGAFGLFGRGREIMESREPNRRHLKSTL